MHPPAAAQGLRNPEEVLALHYAVADTVQLGDLRIGRLVLQPGYRWAEHVRPLAGTDSCQFHHVGVGISRAAHFLMADGTEFDIRPGDAFDIRPGHDNWVIGDEPAASIIWGGG